MPDHPEETKDAEAKGTPPPSPPASPSRVPLSPLPNPAALSSRFTSVSYPQVSVGTKSGGIFGAPKEEVGCDAWELGEKDAEVQSVTVAEGGCQTVEVRVEEGKEGEGKEEEDEGVWGPVSEMLSRTVPSMLKAMRGNLESGAFGGYDVNDGAGAEEGEHL